MSQLTETYANQPSRIPPRSWQVHTIAVVLLQPGLLRKRLVFLAERSR